jgi:hypothetical protein
MSSVDRLRSFGQEGIDEFDRFGLGGLETSLIAQGGRRSLADIGRIGADAGQMADRTFNSAAGIAARQQRALGATMTPTQRASMDRRMGLAKVLGNVDARNRALMADEQRRNVIRSGAGGLRDIIDRQIYANLEGAGNIEEGVTRDAAAGKAGRSAQMAGTIGQSAGLLMSAFGGGS